MIVWFALTSYFVVSSIKINLIKGDQVLVPTSQRGGSSNDEDEVQED